MLGSPTCHQGDHLAARELDALTGSKPPPRSKPSAGRSIAQKSPEPRNDWKETTRTEEPQKGDQQGLWDTGEKAMGKRGTLDGAAEAKRTEDMTSTLEEKNTHTTAGGVREAGRSCRGQEDRGHNQHLGGKKHPHRKKPSSPTYNQGTTTKRLPKGSRGG